MILSDKQSNKCWQQKTHRHFAPDINFEKDLAGGKFAEPWDAWLDGRRWAPKSFGFEGQTEDDRKAGIQKEVEKCTPKEKD
jgi:hypothetical protein